MRILFTGGTGTIGRRLVSDRLERGDEVVVVSRDAHRARTVLGGHGLEVVEGNPMSSGPWQQSASGCDVVVHLAGAGVADRRWTKAYKRLVFDSRIESTRCVVEAIDHAGQRPRVLVSSSATGFYGDTGDRIVDETAPAGDDFLARLAVVWEEQAERAAGSGTRVVMLRTGIVLDDQGGALAKMVPFFRFMLGGPLGSGRQYMPWVHWRDVVGLADLAVRTNELAGPLNVVAPEPETNRKLARILGSVLRRPALVPTPVFALRAVMGELAKYAVVSQRVAPEKARRHDYRFVFPQLRPALEDLVGRP